MKSMDTGLPIDFSERHALPSRDVNAAWQSVHELFDSNPFDTRIAAGVVSALDVSPRLDGRGLQSFGLLAVAGTFGGTELGGMPRVFAVSDATVEALEGPAKRIAICFESSGEKPWRTLHSLSATGYRDLVEYSGQREVVVEMSRMQPHERSLLGVWARQLIPSSVDAFFEPKPKEPAVDAKIPAATWYMRTTDLLRDEAWQLEDSLRSCGVMNSAVTQPPRFQLPESMQEYLEKNTTGSIGSHAFRVGRLEFADFIAKASSLYTKIEAVREHGVNLQVDDQAGATAGLGELLWNRVVAEVSSYPREDITEEQQVRFDERARELAGKLRSDLEQVYNFAPAPEYKQDQHENNALLVSDRFVNTFVKMLRPEDEVVVCSQPDDYMQPFAALWVGERHLVTLSTASVTGGGFMWMHIDTLPEGLDSNSLATMREIISEKLGKVLPKN